MQNTFTQLQPTGFNLDGFFSLIGKLVGGIFTEHFLVALYIFGTLLGIALVTLVIFLFIRMYELRQEEAKKKKQTTASSVSMTQTVGMPLSLAAQNTIWQDIRERILSNNTSDWKLAIIEADVYLDRVLDDKGFHGDTTSDKLKQITPDKLPSVQLAWQGHIVRNRIAHEGSAFVLTMPEARKLLSYYETVFTDLGVI